MNKRLKKNLFPIAIMFIGLVLTSFLYQSLSSVTTGASNLFAHPFTVSKNVLSIEQDIVRGTLSLHRVIERFDQTNSIDISAATHQMTLTYQLIDSKLVTVKSYFLGPQTMIDEATLNYQEWKNKNELFLQLLKENKIVNARQLLNVEIDNLSENIVVELNDLLEFAQNKAIQFKGDAYISFLYAVFSLVLLVLYVIFVAYYVHILSLGKLKQSLANIDKHMKWRKSIMNATPECMIVSTSDGKIVEVNERANIFFGYSSDEFKTLNIDDLVPETVCRNHNELRENFLKSGKNSFTLNRNVKAQLRNGQLSDVTIELNTVRIDDEIFIVSALRDISNELAISKQLEYHSHYDELTALPNRTLAHNRFTELTSICNAQKNQLAFLFLDLDDFKKINDTFGHEAGDQLIVLVANRLTQTLRKHDVIARLGGDEFIILIPQINHLDDIQKKVISILSQFRRPFEIEKKSVVVGASIGVATYPNDGTSFSELLRKSDAAMFHAKAQGQNQFAFYFDSLTHNLSRYFEIEEAFLNTVIERDFFLVFQPQIDLNTQQIIGAEALIRWEHPTLGNVSPQDFIPVAENNGMIIKLGHFIIRESLNFVAYIIAKYNLPKFTISVNLSPRQFKEDDLLTTILAELENRNLSTANLVLEITEGLLLDSSSNTLSLMAKINEQDIVISMDDFGTGYSSLSYLRQFPFKHIKLDKSFIDDLIEKETTAALIKSSIMMAHALDLEVVAEGIETKLQAEKLRELECDFAQGYFFSKPLPKEEFKSYLESKSPIELNSKRGS